MHPLRPAGRPPTGASRRLSLRVSTRIVAALAAVPLLALAACSGGADAATDADAGSTAATGSAATELRLGYFANVTHAPALVGVANGLFAAELGDTALTTQVFNAGPAAIEALNAGAIDATFIGPNPAINGFIKSDGESLRIIAGSTSGGAQFVVRDGIDSAADLKGTNLASPQLGGTQDVALRSWLTEQGLENSISGGGDVTITPTENAQTLQLFQDGKLDGAWLPEPWASRLVLEAGAHVLVDEKDLWDDGQFLTTHLIVSASFLAEHPETVEALLRGTVASVDWLNANPGEAPAVVNAEIATTAGKPLPDEVIARAFTNITFSVDPLAQTLPTLLAAGVTAGTTEDASLDGIYDLRLLNTVLADAGQPTVSSAGLGQE
ncbi:ABC transporter substrate-binding protein [Pengzhenrongella sicca]|uniref:ABC transporter substrate-binding protein n=1 Tax=Pengzhenrongella sicca TaxID=2819238 RepID=A0A8A4ZDB4_9MICO|nr:ABC transporter substrate-binding protein [Pengzhenrongella sicca]QTE29942.1 ABC transporter substrate-binding protein [Pengzhenrongella sicca]